MRLAGLAALLLSSAAFAYGNDGEFGGPHRRINSLALDRFIADVAPRDPIFQWYRCDPLKVGYQLDVSGETVVKSGQFYPEDVAKAVIWVRKSVSAIASGNREEGFRWWVEEGGYTADEPEVFQAVRHFYDPTRTGVLTTGKKTEKVAFLSDMVTGKLGFVNPRLDAKVWALSASPWSLATAERAFGLAGLLQVTAREKQAAYLAKTWRSLGEAMHLLADMTVPAHVRNDAHPPVEGLDTFFPDWSPDPYETMVTAPVVNDLAGGPVPPEAAAAVAQAQTPDQLFDAVARYTNRSFFSRDTVSGTDGKTKRPVKNANGQPAYPSPKLEQYPYEQLKESGRWFYRDTAANVMIAERLEQPNGKVEHDLERSLTWQARQLLPLAIAANVRLLELTLPRVRVVVEGYDPGRRVLRCQAALCRRVGDVDQAVRLVLPTHQERLLAFVTMGAQQTAEWAPLSAVGGTGFDLTLAQPPADLAAILSGEKPAPAGGVSLQVGLDMGGILVLSKPYRPRLPEPKQPEPKPATPDTPGPAPAVDGDPVTLQEAIDQTKFPEQPNQGAVKYGYTFAPNRAPADPYTPLAPSGWVRLIEQGQVHYVTDENRNKARDATDRQFEKPWAAWYEATISVGLGRPNEQAGPTGAWPGTMEMLTRRGGGPWRPVEPPLQVGDAAAAEDFASPPIESFGGYRESCEMMVARGPICLYVTVRLSLMGHLRGYSFSREHGGYRLYGDAPAADFWTDWPGGTKGMGKRVDGWREALPQVTADLARQAVAQWDSWYLRKVFTAAGLKGLYPLDGRPFWLAAADVPGTRLDPNATPPATPEASCSGGFQVPNPSPAPGGSAYHAWVQYTVSICDFDSVRQSADSVLAEAKASYAGKVAEYKRSQPVKLPGADEAAEFVFRHLNNHHRLTFRRANLVASVWGEDYRPKAEAPIALVRDVARLLCRRMQGDRTPLPPSDPADALQRLRWGQLELREVNLTAGQKRSPVRTERLGPEALEQITSATWQGTTLTCQYESRSLDTGFAVSGTLTATCNADGTRLQRVEVAETRTEGYGTPEARQRTWQAGAQVDLPASFAEGELTAVVPKLAVTWVEAQGAKVLAKQTGSAAGTLRLQE